MLNGLTTDHRERVTPIQVIKELKDGRLIK